MNNNRKYTANVGTGVVSIANPNLDGTGSVVTIFTASGNGSIVKNIFIKALQTTSLGMVRLFIDDGSGTTVLYKEVHIPEVVASDVEGSFQLYIREMLYLDSGQSIIASTQQSESFNVIVNASDWNNCRTCSESVITEQDSKTGIKNISTANSNLDGTGSITTVLTAASGTGAAGTIITQVQIKATETTEEGIVRLFINDSTNNYLYEELLIPANVQTSVEPAYRTISINGLYLPAGFSIGASTEKANSFNILAIGTEIVNCDC